MTNQNDTYLNENFIDKVFYIVFNNCHDFKQTGDICSLFNSHYNVTVNHSHITMALDKLLKDDYVQKDINGYDPSVISYRLTYDGFFRFKSSKDGRPYRDLIRSIRNKTRRKRSIKTAIIVNTIAITIMMLMSVIIEYNDFKSNKRIDNIESNISKILKVLLVENK